MQGHPRVDVLSAGFRSVRTGPKRGTWNICGEYQGKRYAEKVLGLGDCGQRAVQEVKRGEKRGSKYQGWLIIARTAFFAYCVAALLQLL